MLEVAPKVTGNAYTAVEYTQGGPNEELQGYVTTAGITLDGGNQAQLIEATRKYANDEIDIAFNEIYPVGSIFFAVEIATVLPSPPRNGIGGILWERLPDDQFLGTSGPYFGSSPGDVTGTQTTTDSHILIEAELASHTHTVGTAGAGTGGTQAMIGGAGIAETGPTGDNQAHTHNLTNLNRIALAAWKRTA